MMNSKGSKTIIWLKYTPLLSLPLIGTFLYIVELFLFKRNLLLSIYLSRKENIYRNLLIKEANHQAIKIICTNYKLAFTLLNFKPPIYLDVNKIKINKLNQNDLYDLMWTLVFCKATTEKTHIYLKGFIPENYPTVKIVILLMNDPFDNLDNFILNTAKTIESMGHLTYIIARKYPVTVLKRLVNISTKHMKLMFKKFIPQGVQIIFPIDIAPNCLNNIPGFRKINRIINNILFFKTITNLNADLLWSFNSEDLEIIRFIKKHTDLRTIYDCVDYFSTTNPKLNHIIKVREKALIKSVDYFFTVSNSITNPNLRIRKPNLILPQGFDFKSFQRTKPSKSTEFHEVDKYKNIMSTIPKPMVGYSGNLTYRIDFALLYKVISSLPNISFVFVGAYLPMLDDLYFDTKKNIASLRKCPNVFFLPPTSNKFVLKTIIQHFSVGIIPYDTSIPFNKHSNPIKFYEYCAVEIPSLSTKLNNLEKYHSIITITNQPNAWISSIKNITKNAQRDRLKYVFNNVCFENNYDKKITRIMDYVDVDGMK